MTLIVGARTETRIELISDTRITHPDTTQIEEIPGRLKLVALSPAICVGYAGRAAPAIDRIRATPHRDASSFDAVVAHLRTEPECDFLVAEAGRPFRQASITDGVVREGELVWIGEADAWAAFEVVRPTVPAPIYGDPYDREPGDHFMTAVRTAYQRVFGDAACTTVAGFEMRIGSRGSGFRYLPQAGFSAVNLSGQLNESTAQQHSTAAAGAFSYTILTPTEPGVALVAVYISQPQLGYVYLPLRHDQPIEVRQTDHETLVSHVRTEYGVVVDGLTVGNASFRTPGKRT